MENVQSNFKYRIDGSGPSGMTYSKTPIYRTSKGSPHIKKPIYHLGLRTRDLLLIEVSDWILGIMQACNAYQITYTPHLRVN